MDKVLEDAQLEAEFEEVLNKAGIDAKDKVKDLPEAPVSANVRIKTPRGHQWQITIRDNKVNDIIQKIEILEDVFQDKGWVVPEWQQESREKLTKCPDCGSDLKEGVTKAGKKYIGCTNKQWNTALGKYEGCKFFKYI